MNNQAEQYDEGICTIPPQGWWCSRTPGHEGPCAARPLEEPDDAPLSAADEARINRAWEKHKAAGPAPTIGAEMLTALHQYANDLRYPPAADSIPRRLAMVEALIKKASGHD